MCMTRLNELPLDKPVTVEPMKAFPLKKDLVTTCPGTTASSRRSSLQAAAADAPDGTWRMAQADVDRVQEFRSASSATSARTSATCCASTSCTSEFIGPRFLVYAAALEMHPLDVEDRTADLRARTEWALQHHEVLHQGVPRGHHHHGQRDHPAQGAGGGPFLRPRAEAVPRLRLRGVSQ
jgi:succinate dehydrogenase/fumarate reductase-like Fe-S protein